MRSTKKLNIEKDRCNFHEGTNFIGFCSTVEDANVPDPALLSRYYDEDACTGELVHQVGLFSGVCISTSMTITTIIDGNIYEYNTYKDRECSIPQSSNQNSPTSCINSNAMGQKSYDQIIIM